MPRRSRTQKTVLPAYAGMIPNGTVTLSETSGAPRVCGDDPERTLGATAYYACSPRMRG